MHSNFISRYFDSTLKQSTMETIAKNILKTLLFMAVYQGNGVLFIAIVAVYLPIVYASAYCDQYVKTYTI